MARWISGPLESMSATLFKLLWLTRFGALPELGIPRSFTSFHGAYLEGRSNEFGGEDRGLFSGGRRSRGASGQNTGAKGLQPVQDHPRSLAWVEALPTQTHLSWSDFGAVGSLTSAKRGR